MATVSSRHRLRLAGVAFVSAVVACNGSELTSPSSRGLQVTAATSGSSAALLALTGHIAFVSTRAGNAEIYVVKGDGTGVTRLTRNSATDGQPAWSPNGKKIAFVSNRAGNDEILRPPRCGAGGVTYLRFQYRGPGSETGIDPAEPQS